MSFKLTGLAQVLANIRAAGSLGVKAAENGVELFATHVISKSQDIVPFDEGDLQKSVINRPIVSGVKVIGYDSPYAIRQHEDTSLMHPGQNSKNPQRGAQGQAKFLERPLLQESSKMLVFVAAEVKKAL